MSTFEINTRIYIDAKSLLEADRKFCELLDEHPEIVCLGWTSFAAERDAEKAVPRLLALQKQGNDG